MKNSVLEYLCCVHVILLCIVIPGSFLRRNIPMTDDKNKKSLTARKMWQNTLIDY
jgi:hypothetical protein